MFDASNDENDDNNDDDLMMMIAVLVVEVMVVVMMMMMETMLRLILDSRSSVICAVLVIMGPTALRLHTHKSRPVLLTAS